MTLSAGTKLGPYEIVSLIGAGGFGEVYRARDTRLNRTVAIKVLSQELSAKPEARQRFEREAKTIAALNHPHICAPKRVASLMPFTRHRNTCASPKSRREINLLIVPSDGRTVIAAC